MTGWTKMGYCKMRKTYSSTNKILREEYFNGKGEPTNTRSGYFYGKIYEYDEADRLIREWTYGADGQPFGGNRGYATIEYSYDENGKRTAAYYNSRGSRVK